MPTVFIAIMPDAFHPMNAYLACWKPREVDWDNPGSHLLRHARSQQYRKVRRGDRIYLLSARDTNLYLLGRISVDARVGRIEAASRLDCELDELQGNHHIFAAPGTEVPVNPIECEDALRQLYVLSGGHTQPIKEPIIAQRFQSMRHITSGSAVTLDDLIAANANT